eukprot:CAMPEP_0197889266 /NCGR_PEP_ID=MMETSP1439-20131203/24093_1 /TAXON_ID=66791 /ORGANISM="Gonyaulax spinifera, Strain CCMP409" /LENGTH=36 /DNA_ID= /DNA_START= /DNA_END= /DNA_ORIENTATION=
MRSLLRADGTAPPRPGGCCLVKQRQSAPPIDRDACR